MSHKNSLLFIGGVDKGHTPTNGETMKTNCISIDSKSSSI